ncbi:hypothetical protein [Xenorhabdus szentirmaii]|uniref:Uncharacterized protein n=1 Tax=Xenorhabdus szentirmaii DSM 16338 TaxID=1427518 RepID=W1IRI5_9GAMM|nr:hypothetical protein [Xenorhabdus szentirmaii]PHM30575.1 hypothetical protein Xsze_04166 [Xenorhabdus szentirmaii DSM 16338]CDL81044.1 hypothetical protein XSR1_100089 [Xenorhabdus szentirmaii DSM 16338]
MSIKLPIQQATILAVAVADISRLPRIFADIRGIVEPAVKYKQPANENHHIAKVGLDFADDDKSGRITITDNNWHSSKLRKVFGKEVVDKIDNWLSMKMLDGVTDLLVSITRIHTVLGGKSDFILMAYTPDLDADNIEDNRKLIYAKADHLLLNEELGYDAYYHSAIGNMSKSLSDSFYEVENGITPVIPEKLCKTDLSNEFSLHTESFSFKAVVNHENSKITGELGKIALLSDGYSTGIILSDESTEQELSLPKETPAVKPKPMNESASISVNGRSFAFGSF